jgi:hypothetical protein
MGGSVRERKNNLDRGKPTAKAKDLQLGISLIVSIDSLE